MVHQHIDASDDHEPAAAAAVDRPDPQQLYRRTLARILQAVSDRGSATISELVEVAGVSRPTVQRALAELEGLGVVDQADMRPSGTGRPARSWIPRTTTSAVMALDIRREESHLVVCGLTGRSVVDTTFGHEELIAQAADPERAVIPELVLQRTATHLAAAGISADDVLESIIGVTGIVDCDGGVLLSSTVPALTGYPLGRRAVELLGLPSVTVENDMNLRAVGELRAGAADGLSTFLYLTNHSFLRPAVVLDGALRHGDHRTVGEGDLLTRSGVISPRHTHGGRTVDFFDIAPGIDSGTLDHSWLQVLNDQLAKVIGVLCYVLDPESVLIHGGPVTTGPEAIADLSARCLEYTVTDSAPRILAAGHGPELTTSGALTLALRNALGAVLGLPDPPLPRLRLITS